MLSRCILLSAVPILLVGNAVRKDISGPFPYSVVEDFAKHRDYGCFKGYCWAYCGFGRQWCYTSKGRSQDYKYVTCQSKEDCNGSWKCAGPCSIGLQEFIARPRSFGCFKKYCWAYCSIDLPIGKQWCYTTKGWSQDYGYVACKNEGNCNGSWKCAGPCTIGPLEEIARPTPSGCYKGYCWAYCLFGKQWCYTTKGSSQDYNYVACTTEEAKNCSGEWKCAGPCTL